MGRVWRATDVVLHRDVAIKELVPPPGLTPAERQEMRERSLREARAIARLNNINVVRVFDVLRTDADPWIVMEYVPNRSLQDTLAADGPFNALRAAEIGLGVLNALRAAHRAGVVHRDVKPGNVLIATDGRTVLTDFGLATVPGDPNVTRTGLVLGSPAYIAPERARDGTAGPAADLWSLGATLFAAVEGQSPFARPSAIATLAALATENVPVSRNAGPLKPVLNGLLRKDPAQRMDAEEAERLLARAAGRRSKISFPMSPTMRRPGVGRERPSLPSGPGGPPVLPGSGWGTATGSAPVVPGPRPPVTGGRPGDPQQGRPAAASGRPDPQQGRSTIGGRPQDSQQGRSAVGGRPGDPQQGRPTPPMPAGPPPSFTPGKATVGRTPVPPPGARPPAKPLDATRFDTPQVKDQGRQTPPTAPMGAPGHQMPPTTPMGVPGHQVPPTTPMGVPGQAPPTTPMGAAGLQAPPTTPMGAPNRQAPATTPVNPQSSPSQNPPAQSMAAGNAPTNALRTGFTAADVVAHRRKQAAPEHEQSLAQATSGYPVVTPRGQQPAADEAEQATTAMPADAAQSDAAQAGAAQDDAARADAAQSGAAQVDAVQSGAAQSGAAQSGAAQAPATTPVPAPGEDAGATADTEAAAADSATEKSAVETSAAEPEAGAAPTGAAPTGAVPATAALATAAPADAVAVDDATGPAVDAESSDPSADATGSADEAPAATTETPAEAAGATATTGATATAGATAATGAPVEADAASETDGAATAAETEPAVQAAEPDTTASPAVVEGSAPPAEEAVAASPAAKDVPEATPEQPAAISVPAARPVADPAPVSPAPVSPAAVSPAPAYQAPVSPAPTYQAPVSPAPTYQAPVSPAATYQAPVSPSPVYQAPVPSVDSDKTSMVDFTTVVPQSPPAAGATQMVDYRSVPNYSSRPPRRAWNPAEVRSEQRRPGGITILGTTLTRQQAIIGLAILLTFVLLIGIIVVQAFGGSDDEPTGLDQNGISSSQGVDPAATTGQGGATSAAPSPSATTSAAATIPANWKTYSGSGFKLPVPSSVSGGGGGNGTQLRWKNRLLIINKVDGEPGDPVNYWRSQDTGRYPQYEEIGISEVAYKGEAADWEFYYTTSSGNRQRVVKRVFAIGGTTYNLSWYTTPEDWDKAKSDIEAVFAGFTAN